MEAHAHLMEPGEQCRRKWIEEGIKNVQEKKVSFPLFAILFPGFSSKAGSALARRSAAEFYVAMVLLSSKFSLILS